MHKVSELASDAGSNEWDANGEITESEVHGYGARQWFGLAVGPILFAMVLLAAAPQGLEAAGWRTAAAAILMAVWWITEAIPIPATALLPLVLFPVLGIGNIRETTQPYANPLIYLFMGGFVIALGMQRWGLHVRIALNIIRAIGTRPKAIIVGFMMASAFLSMWVSNTATTMMMLPIGLSVLELARRAGQEERASKDRRHFAVALMLAIAYSASVGGLGTLIGTPPNALLAGFLSETYHYQIGFAQWMLVGVPVVLLGLPVIFFVLTRIAFPVRMKTLPGGRQFIRAELEKLGPVTAPEKMVAVVFVLVAVLWMTRPLLTSVIPGLSDAGIAILGALLLFLLPVNLRRGEFVLSWRAAERLPWGVLILFGGGLTLASAIQRTGLAKWIGTSLSGVSGLPILLVILIVATVIILLTELTSNTATAAAFLPIMASVAVGIGQNPLLLVVPATLAASCAFMLPVATPPNAVVYSSGTMTVPQMAKAGILLNLLFIILITALTFSIVIFVFNVKLGLLPAWAGTP